MKPIYLEPDEEITSVIERISQLPDKTVAVVVPKNSTIFQSLVNLKLLARQADKAGKKVAIISGNKVGTKLAKQVGLETYASLGNAGRTPVVEAPSQVVPTASPVSDTLPDGTPVNRYSPDAALPPPVEPVAAPELPQEESIEPVEIASPVATAESVPGPVEGSLKDSAPPEPVKAEAEVTPASSPKEPADLPPAPVAASPASQSDNLPSFVSRGIRTTTQSTFVFPWKSALAALGLVLVAAVITFLFLPKATVTMTFPATLLSSDFALTATTNASTGDNVIAGNLLTSDKSDTASITATGKKDVGTKATGNISIKNCEDSTSHSLPAGSKLTSSSKDFLTNSAVTIPAGQFSNGGQTCNSSAVTVAVTATQAGDTYNLSSATFTISGLAGHFTATGSTTGGTTKTVIVLAQEDVDKAFADLSNRLTTNATADLKASAGSQTVVDGAIKTVTSTQKVDKTVGSQTDTATATMSIEVYTIAFDPAAVNNAVKTALSAKLTANQQLVIPDDKKPTLSFKSLSDDRTTLVLDVSASGFAAPDINKIEVAKSVKNKSVSAVQAMLKEKYQAEEVKVEILPGWWFHRLPLLSQAISVDYGFTEATPTTDAIPGT